MAVLPDKPWTRGNPRNMQKHTKENHGFQHFPDRPENYRETIDTIRFGTCPIARVDFSSRT